MSEQKSLVESKDIKKKVSLFTDYHCKECGSSTIFVYKSDESICLKCDDCNWRIIFRTDDKKQGALEELKELKIAINNLKNGKVAEIIDNPEFDYEYYIKNRISELEGCE